MSLYDPQDCDPYNGLESSDFTFYNKVSESFETPDVVRECKREMFNRCSKDFYTLDEYCDRQITNIIETVLDTISANEENAFNSVNIADKYAYDLSYWLFREANAVEYNACFANSNHLNNPLDAESLGKLVSLGMDIAF